MKILIFNSHKEKIIQEIQYALKSFQNCQVILTKDHHEFKKQLPNCFSGETIVVFFINTEKDMVFLESMQNHFVDIKLVINQSERKKSFISRSLKLHPRIITHSDENSELLLGVIQGIIKKNIIDNQKTIINKREGVKNGQ
jgi:lantibiotic modifying enzyme